MCARIFAISEVTFLVNLKHSLLLPATDNMNSAVQHRYSAILLIVDTSIPRYGFYSNGNGAIEITVIIIFIIGCSSLQYMYIFLF